ncbi:uncharacterized protein LOC125377251 [Haliotis rufescens]|uniref:uncharacterized protein LOC125377251 n=1 Tax=Haliotis rufescens TaxID=6454 RepID=UPI00201ED306|nr:uncharacterized protein LOC125377251 [Haliotis rufescens]
MAGPYHNPPLPNLRISPIVIVPKKEVDGYRIIHHLSYPDEVSSAETRSQNQTDTSAQKSVAYLKSEAFALIKASVSSNTQHTYAAALRSFDKFRHNHKIPLIWPVPVDDILCYIASMSRKAFASSTIAQHLSALGRHHKINSWSDPTENLLVRKCMQGYRNSAALVSTPDARHPITIDMLKRLPSALQAICMSGYEACLFAAMFNLAFFAFLWIGEIAFVTKMNQDRTLKLADVGIIAQAVHVKICFSKNDQHGKGTTLIIPGKSNPTIRPVRSLSVYLSLRSAQPGQFFIHLNGKAVTRYQFSAVLRNALQFLNFHTQNYNTRSFRIGAATYAATQGIPHELLCIWGRWKSAAYAKYIRINML